MDNPKVIHVDGQGHSVLIDGTDMEVVCGPNSIEQPIAAWASLYWRAKALQIDADRLSWLLDKFGPQISKMVWDRGYRIPVVNSTREVIDAARKQPDPTYEASK